jgi:methionyl aminopeptidase
MIHPKSKEEIAIMREGGRILARVLLTLTDRIRPGVSELEIDELAEELIRRAGGEPGFKRVEGYRHTICVSTNDVVVHGIPTKYRFQEGDVAGIDCGVFYKGFHTDMAETRQVLPKSREDVIGKFLETGKRALIAGIRAARFGNRVGHISKAIQDIVEKEGGYSVVRSLVGHGVGKRLHEAPEVPGFLRGDIGKTPLLIPGMTIAIEVIYNMGGSEVVFSNDDGWTISTKDGSLSGLFERTIAITDKDPIVLTR